MVLVPDAYQPIMLGSGGKEKAIRRECQEVDRVGRSDLPDTGPASDRQVWLVMGRAHVEPDLGLWKIEIGRV